MRSVGNGLAERDGNNGAGDAGTDPAGFNRPQ